MAKSILLFLALIALTQSIYFYPLMPDITASHFDSAGNPNSWMKRETLIMFYLGITAILAVIFLLIPKFPNKMRNLPNRDYWLAKERKEESNKYINSSTLRVGIATFVLLIYVMQLVFEANLNKDPVLSGNIVWALILYFIFLGVWLVKFYRRFGMPG
jgi:uncharacterized membrane protein